MTAALAGLPGLPAGAVEVDAASGSVALRLAPDLYPLGAVLAAAYAVVGRCFVLVDREPDGRWRVTLSWKKPPAGDPALARLAGEFSAELLACAWRAQLATEHRVPIEAATARAIAGAMGPPSLDDLEDFGFGQEPFDDPLGIAMSWEDKYARKKPEEPR